MPSFARNIRLLGLFQISRMALFPVAILPLYLKDHCGLSVGDVLWLQAFFGLVVALAEFPSGYLADRIGYRRTLVWGGWLVALGWAGYPFASGFESLLVVEVVLGIGIACISGCDSALLYESLKAQGRPERFEGLFSQQHSLGGLAEGAAALSAGLLYALHPSAPFFVQVAVSLIMVGLVAPLREPERPVIERTGSHLRQAFHAVASALVAQPRLRALLVLWTLLSLAAYIPIWLFAPYAQQAGVRVAWLGPLWAVGNFVVAAGVLWGPRLARRLGAVGAALLCVALLALGYAGLALSHALLGCAFYYALCAMRGLSTSLLTPHEHALIPSPDRAALVSFRSTLFRMSFFVIGPLVGALVDSEGYHVTFAVCGGLLLAATGLFVLPALGVHAQRRDLPQPGAALDPAP